MLKFEKHFRCVSVLEVEFKPLLVILLSRTGAEIHAQNYDMLTMHMHDICSLLLLSS